MLVVRTNTVRRWFQPNNEKQSLIDAGSSRARLFHEIVHPIVSSLGGSMVSLGTSVLMVLFIRREDAREAAGRVEERMKKIQYEVTTAWRAASGGLKKVPSMNASMSRSMQQYVGQAPALVNQSIIEFLHCVSPMVPFDSKKKQDSSDS